MRTRDTGHVVNTRSDLTMVGEENCRSENNSDAIIRMEFLEWSRINYDAPEEIYKTIKKIIEIVSNPRLQDEDFRSLIRFS